MSKRRLTFLLACALNVPCPAAVPAQVITGRVVERGAGTPIRATLTLRSRDETVATTTADSAGRFRFDAGVAGEYSILARHLGYADAHAQFDIRRDETLEVLLQLTVDPIALPALTIMSERPAFVLDERLKQRGFYQRMRDRGREGTSDGYFFDAQQIREKRPFYMTDVVRDVHGAAPNPRNPAEIRFRSGRCTPTIYLNGLPTGTRYVNDLISPYDVIALEVYPRVHVDPTGMVQGPGCSLIIWSGRPPR